MSRPSQKLADTCSETRREYWPFPSILSRQCVLLVWRLDWQNPFVGPEGLHRHRPVRVSARFPGSPAKGSHGPADHRCHARPVDNPISASSGAGVTPRPDRHAICPLVGTRTLVKGLNRGHNYHWIEYKLG